MKACLALLFLSAAPFLSACSLTPAQIQSDATIATSGLLATAVVLDPKDAPHIKGDATNTAKALQGIIPQFFPNANAGQLASAAVSQAMTLLGTKLASSPTGAKITGILGIVEAPILGYLGNVASPTAFLTAVEQANALAFFMGVCQGIANWENDPTLAPPQPPAPAPTPTPTPAPAPAAPAPAKSP